MEGGELSKASTFDALSGHVWQARTKAIESAPLQLAQLSYAVDIRERMNPPLPKQFCGNGIYSACARCQTLSRHFQGPSRQELPLPNILVYVFILTFEHNW